MPIPAIRHSHANDHDVREDGDYVLYWMTAFRRPRFNFALQHAVDRAKQFGKPLVIFEPLDFIARLSRWCLRRRSSKSSGCGRTTSS